MKKLEIVVAVASNLAIGNHHNKMPWHLPEDLKFFKNLTSHHIVIMGKNTLLSIGKALPNRVNLVISKDESLEQKYEGIKVFKTLDEAIAFANSPDFVAKRIFILGGGMLYQSAIEKCDVLHITYIDKEFSGTVFFPDWKQYAFKLINEDSHVSEAVGCTYSFQTWEK